MVNLDGLVNSWEYFESYRLALCRYWRESCITYLVDAWDGEQFWALVPTRPAYGGCVDRLELLATVAPMSPGAELRTYRLRDREPWAVKPWQISDRNG